ncbi:uncharacterized protein LOC117568019 isoform X3 [Drosophila albomicans]|uniref:Uncharacterized protein LOC117568019 isoform X3 n=1 Tax=Drosophila albomicans TaxID=7291 RepID=A0A9C6WHA2_DROAB|nr:uncharacterized protein LOC117568019 isoform X3 [Drosophila albomicans]XP_051859481.1 uncharacterized protein LOC117568019 isoform X3 [Drosophila albomicans]XP_051859482.1 uncharacterized protein LOC117568019 isoform X3 [Drosophila albomicans]XP_051859483.1 uncharacterized protein LOC117568019 isoform X3 [Drosophila albomicans]
MTCPQTLKTFQLTDTIARTLGKLVRITGLSCQVVDPMFCRFENCVLKAKSRDFKELSMVVRLLQIPVDNITLRVEFFRRSYTSQSILQFEIDGCQYWRNKRRNPIAKTLYMLFRLENFTNVNHSCPYNHDIIVDRMQINRNLNMPLPLAKDDYTILAYWSAYKVLRSIISITMQVVD